MDDEIVEHPGGRAAAAAERAADIDESTQRRFNTAIAGRLEEPEEPGLLKIGDRRIRQTAQFLGFGGALSQYRHQEPRPCHQLGQIVLCHSHRAVQASRSEWAAVNRSAVCLCAIVAAIFVPIG